MNVIGYDESEWTMGRQNEGIGCTWPGRRDVSLFLCLPIDILILILILIPKFDCSPPLRAVNFQFHVTTTLSFSSPSDSPARLPNLIRLRSFLMTTTLPVSTNLWFSFWLRSAFGLVSAPR